MMAVPQPILAVLPSWTPAEAVGIQMPLSRGQVRRLTHSLESGELTERLALVLRVDKGRDYAEIMFVHPYAELATDTDLIVPPEHSSIAYQIVVETDVRGVVWLPQLGPIVGVLDASALEALGAVALGEVHDSPDLVSGLPLRGRLDRRWDFKASQGSSLRTLAADCTAALLDDRTVKMDASILSPVLLAALDDRESALLKLLDVVRRCNVVFDLDDLEVLEEMGALDVGAWIDALGEMGGQLYKSYFLPLVETALSGGGSAASDVSQAVWLSAEWSPEPWPRKSPPRDCVRELIGV